jgi:hypothetical protein
MIRIEYIIPVVHDNDDIKDIWYHIWYHIWYWPSCHLWYHSQLRPHFGHVRWQITWQWNDFNVSTPSCADELGRGAERRLAEARSGAWQRSGADWSLGVLGRAWQSLADAMSGAWQTRAKVAREAVETKTNLKVAAETARWPQCCRILVY